MDDESLSDWTERRDAKTGRPSRRTAGDRRRPQELPPQPRRTPRHPALERLTED